MSGVEFTNNLTLKTPKKKDNEIKDLLAELDRNERSYSAYKSEARTNVLLYSSDHFAKTSQKFKDSLSRTLNIAVSAKEKMRLTINHFPKVMDKKINSVLKYSPGATCLPYKSDDVHSVKNAKLSRSILEAVKKKNDWVDKRSVIVTDFFILGETFVYTYFDETAGPIIAYEPIEGEEFEPYLDEATGQIIEPELQPDVNKPIRTGQVIHEVFQNYDAEVEAGIKNINDSAYVGFSKVYHRSTLEAMIDSAADLSDEEKEERKGWIKKDDNDKRDSYMIFSNGIYEEQENDDLFKVNYRFYRPGPEYPEGRALMFLSDGIVFDRVLQKDINENPIFPIRSKICKRIPGSSRGYSPMRAGRPIAAEINRSASKMAEQQIANGDDKIITTMDDSITEKVAGVQNIKLKRGFDYQVVKGSSGEQFLQYYQQQTAVFYQIMDEDLDDISDNNTADITIALYKSAKKRSKYVVYIEPIEELFKELAHDAIELCKAYLDDDALIQMVGTNEAVNIAEFKNLKDIDYMIDIEESTDDAESMMGQYVKTRDIMQYLGKSLPPATLAKVLMECPFGDNTKMLSDMFITENRCENIILSLDRGEFPDISEFDKNDIIIPKLIERMSKADFAYMEKSDPKLRERYMAQYQLRNMIEKKKTDELRAANQGMIPMDGPMVKVDLYVNEPGNPNKIMKAVLPQGAVKWTLDQVALRRGFMDWTQNMPKQAQIDLLGGGNGNRQINGNRGTGEGNGEGNGNFGDGSQGNF